MTQHGSETVEEPKPGWGIGEVFIGIALLLVAGTIVSGMYQVVTGEQVTGPVTLGRLVAGLAGAWIAFIGTALYVSHGRPGGLSGQLGFSFRWRSDLPKGLAVGIAGQLMVAVIYFPVRLLDPKAADSVSDVAKNATAGAHGWLWIPFAFCLVIGAPVAEELFFRGVTLRAFARRFGPLVGILISGTLFGLSHFEGIQAPALIAFGCLLAWRATATGRIGETIVAHGTFNGLTLIALALS